MTYRKTIRKYSDREISEQTLREIIDEAVHAPTTGNMQLYSVVVTRSEAGKQALAPTHFGQPQCASASVVLTVCADYNRFVRWCEHRNAEPGYDNLQSLVAAGLDAVFFAQQICNAAEARGIGTCILGTTTYNAAEIAQILRLPKRVVPVTTITMGYPAEDPEDPGRLPIEAVMHDEYYHDYTPDDIDRLYAEKESRADSAQFVSENGKETLAQVFTDVRYPRATNEVFSEKFARFIAENYPLA